MVLGPHSDLSEVLWKFCRLRDEKKRLILEQNPHFYKALPISPEAYGGKFRKEPIRRFETIRHETISVLVDNPGLAGRVFLETAREVRAFGNVWVPKDAIIFKGWCPLLRGFSLTPC